MGQLQARAFLAQAEPFRPAAQPRVKDWNWGLIAALGAQAAFWTAFLIWGIR